MADGFGRLVRDAPPERLEQVMRSPARKPILDGIFWQMPKQLDVSEASGLKTSIRWTITGRADGETDVYLLEVDNGRSHVIRGDANTDARLTITLDGVDFLRLISGNLDPMKAYFKGRIKLSGDIMVAAKLATLFRMPGASGSNGGNGGQGGDGGDGRRD
jgi:putative sterol carrier protein